MVIIDTIGVIVIVGDEWSALQCATAGRASETVGMETLAHCLKDPIGDPLPTARTHRQRALQTHTHRKSTPKTKANVYRKASICVQTGQNQCGSLWNVMCLAHSVAVLTLRCAVTVVELHALQGALTAHAAETMRVEEFIHRSHCGLRSGQSLSTFTTHLWGEKTKSL